MTSENVASIDLGSNSCRLRIADQNGKILYRDSKSTKLGEGLFATNNLAPEAINRGLEALKEYSRKMKEYHVCSYRAVATASCRVAQNGKNFVDQVKTLTGICLEVIDTFEEARLNLKGALLNAPKQVQYVVVFDLGGASTEITLAQNNFDGTILYTSSIPFGARNATEAYHLEEYDQNEAQKLVRDIQKYVQTFMINSGFEQYKQKCCLIATSSTPLRLCSMICRDKEYNREKNDGKTLQTKEIDQAVSSVYHMDLKQRFQSPYIGENRAPIFVAACVIFKTICHELGFDQLIVSYKSAQDAILEELKTNGKIN